MFDLWDIIVVAIMNPYIVNIKTTTLVASLTRTPNKDVIFRRLLRKMAALGPLKVLLCLLVLVQWNTVPVSCEVT